MKVQVTQHVLSASAFPASVNRKFRYRFFPGCLIALVLILSTNVYVYAQNTIRVKGKITAPNAQPVARASVLVKGSATGVNSDDNGNFEITAPANGTLVISSVGYAEKEVPVGSRLNIQVRLEPAGADLDQVVVVGYGTQRKRDVTGSVASIKGEQLKEVPSANAVQALTGRVAGVDIARTSSRPGAAGQIRIRGNRSLSGENNPFIVVDGIPFSGSINDLNTDDIANIDILKDASATAIYGSRGSNGVILITTKRGKTGKPQISYNSYYGVADIIGKYDLFTGTEFKAFRDAAGYSASPGYSLMEQEGIANGVSTDWQDVAFKKGGVVNQELSVTGGSEGVTYSFSGGYFNEKGVIPGQSFERFSLRSTVDAKIGNRIKVGINSLNSMGYTNGEGVNPMYAITRITPLTPVYNKDGSPNLYPLAGTVDETTTMNPLTLENRESIVDRKRRFRSFNSLYGELEIMKNLKYRLNIGLDFTQENRGTFNGPNTIQNAAATTTAQANATLRNAEAWTYTIENLLTYDKTFADQHKVNFTGLYSVQQDRNFTSRLDGTGFPAQAVQYYNFNLASQIIVPPTDNSFNRNGLMSFMGRVNYVFGDRYILTATFRRDGSSVFPGGKWLNYPAFALGWNVRNESFMTSLDAVSNLKLRVGYGVTGNQGIPANATRGSLSSNRYTFGSENVLGYYVTGLANNELEWEATRQYNLGLDYGLFNNRITGSIELYRQTTDNLLVQKSLPRSNGATSYWTNAANTRGKGIEVNISSVNIQSPAGFTWTMDMNFSVNREEIVQLADPTTKQDIGNGWFVGQPVNVIYDFNKTGIWQTKDLALATTFGAKPGQIRLEDKNGNNRIDDGDRSVIGNFQPDWIGGMTHRIAYKNFDLSTVLFARMGGTLVTTYLQNNGTGTAGYFAFGSGRVNQYAVDYWTESNPTNAFPKPDASSTSIQYSSTLGYYDASFIKVRSINLGYNLSEGIIKRASLSSMRVYFTVQNPFILYSPFVKSGLGFDPEGTGTGGAVQTQGAGTNQGVSSRAITVGLNTPSTRQFIFGLNVRL